MNKKLTAIMSAVAITATMLSPITVSHAATATLTVNPSEAASETNFKTIRDAAAKAKELNPTSEADRVTINVTPGSYEEQVRLDDMKFVTLQKDPTAEGTVTLHWYFCTGYCTSNTDLTGLYDPNIDWSDERTWTGYNGENDTLTRYNIGDDISNVAAISYYTKDGQKHENVPRNSQLKRLGGLGWSYDKMAPLIVTKSSSDIVIKDLNLINTIPVMVTQGQKDGHVTPEHTGLPVRDTESLTNCDESTVPEAPASVMTNGAVDLAKYNAEVAKGTVFTAAQSAYLAQSSKFNERGHALAILGDRITVENVRVRGNQDSVWVSDGRCYFKNCDLIGGTDYIYGSASAVFDSCKLGMAGFTDTVHGAQIATPNTPADKKYGYLFWNCTAYNTLANSGVNSFGGAWGDSGQATFYNTTLDNGNTLMLGKAKVEMDAKGWSRFGAENGLSRLYEYGTKNADGTAADVSRRIVNKPAEDGGPGMGTVLDKWQVLEFNPRNVLGTANGWSDDWDPMGFDSELTSIDAALNTASVTVPAGEETEIALPTPKDNNIEYHWVSASANAVVSNDGTKLTVVRPAAGADAISSSVTLYARDKTTGYGDRKEIPVTINATTDTTNVFNIPISITQSVAGANKYTVTVSKDGALIKSQEIDITGTEAAAAIENIPASADGIAYNVKVVSQSDDFTISAPAAGVTNITGKTGVDVPITVTAQKLVDDTVTLDKTVTPASGKQTYDIIALAKAAGADSSIDNSDFITVSYDVKVGAKPTASSFVDITSGTPSNANSAVADRFMLMKLNNSWTQIDTVDNSQGFSGSADGEGQCLNITGKFDYSDKVHTVSATVDYKNSTVTVNGSDSGAYKNKNTPYTFAGFPQAAAKGNVKMGIFPANTTDNWEISNIQVTYKKLVTDSDPSATDTPEATEKPSDEYKVSVASGSTEYIKLVKPASASKPASVTSYTVNDSTPTAAGSVYTDDDNLKVQGEFATTLGDVVVTIDDKSFTKSMNVRLDASDPNKGAYTEKAGSTPLHITAKKSGSFTIYYRRQTTNSTTGDYAAGDGKDIRLCHKNGSGYDAPTAGTFTFSHRLNDEMAYLFGTQTFELTEGEQYILWARGTTGTLLGYEFAPSGISPSAVEAADGEELADELTVKAGDTVKLKVEQRPGSNIKPETTPNTTLTQSGYDGAAGRYYLYYTFTMPAQNTTVTAKITAVTAPTATPSVTDKPETTDSPVVTTPSPTPNAEATDTPSKTGIEKAIVVGGNTQVYLNGISEGVVIAAKYENGVMKAVKTAEVTQTTALPIVIEGIEADKVMVWNSLTGMEPLCAAVTTTGSVVSPTDAPTSTPAMNTPKPTSAPDKTPMPAGEAITVDFTTMSAVPVYSAGVGQGFVAKSDAIMPSGYAREVAPASAITISSEGAKVTESSGSYLHKKNNSNDGDDDNNGGLIYRVDTGAPGAYHIEVEVTGSSADTLVAPTGMQASRLTGTGAWDTAGLVAHTVYASWEGSKWSYDFATGEDFVEIEIEPKTLATPSAPQTVGIKSIKLTPLALNAAGDKPTIHILGDSTQKTYTFNETISAWGQVLGNYFDPAKVNVRNYSMGGRAMKSNYNEGRFGEILINGKTGDYVFIHSAHNDETISTNRFSRGAGSVKDDLAANNENYNKWLDMYVSAIKARGMTPVLVTAMPRTGSGRYSENASKPNGFNPDSPANMRAKAASDDGVGLAELYAGAKAYIDKLDAKEVSFIYNSYEAGESPANSAANGTNGDGTHYREAASKQWSRIILQSIYDQSVAEEDTYKDKPIMQKLVSLMDADVQAAAQSGDWSAVFPEVASDVSAVDVIPGAQKQPEANYYYRNNIEKALQLGLLHKDTANLFKPTQTITVGEFARGAEKAFGLDANSLTSYTKTYAELSAEATASVSMASVDETEINDADLNDTDVSLMANGDITVTVEQPTGGTLTVYNESAFHTATVDVPAGVTASQKIGDNDYFTLTAPPVVVTKKNNDAGFTNKEVSVNAIEIRKADDTNGNKQAIYTAKASGILTMYLYFDNTKLITCENTTDGTKSEKYIEGEKSSNRANVFGEVTFDVEAGKTYALYTNGGTGRLFGVKYESTDYPQSTTSLTVNSGDEIRVVAIPNENYVNKSIKLNGEIKATSKEYTFNATANTTVTAEFEAEPALVETTKIASDAALTREVMGAILYDAYKASEAKYSGETGGIWSNIQTYIGQNGSVPSPDDPSYDPNIQYEGTPYIPLTGWGALTDKGGLNSSLYGKVKAAYNLGLIRCEDGAARGVIKNGTKLEPTVEVTRAKAAKALVFAFLLTQPPKGENQTVPEGFALQTPAAILAPNSGANTTVFTE